MTRLKTLLVGLCAAASIGAAEARSRVYVMDGYSAALNFSCDVLGMMPVEGAFTRFIAVISVDDAAPEEARAVVRVDANSLKSDPDWINDLRGPDFFDVAAHPEFGFVSRTAIVEGHGKLRLDGMLTLRGQSHPVSLRVRYSLPDKAGAPASIIADGEVDRTTFGMDAYELVVSDEVAIEVSGIARPAYGETVTAALPPAP